MDGHVSTTTSLLAIGKTLQFSLEGIDGEIRADIWQIHISLAVQAVYRGMVGVVVTLVVIDLEYHHRKNGYCVLVSNLQFGQHGPGQCR